MKAACATAAVLVLATTLGAATGTDARSSPIRVSEPGTRATGECQGEGFGLWASADGATLRAGFQNLSGSVTSEGLRLTSTETGGGRLRLVATSIGRENALWPSMSPLPMLLPGTGTVEVRGNTARFVRAALTEEYSVGADGVRQDFIVAEPPTGGEGELVVELALSGATAEATAGGAHFVLDGSRRTLAYSKLGVMDAAGRGLRARLEVISPDRLSVRVDDTMATYPVRIDPTFSDADWVGLTPALAGANGAVYCSVVDAEGNLYIGGSFTFVGSVVCHNIAKWDGSTWSPLGLGIGGGFERYPHYVDSVRALATIGTDLYAAGYFDTAGGVPARRIAKWDGNQWSPLGSGIPGSGSGFVSSLAVIGTDLYVAEHFARADGFWTSVLAKWNGTVWSDIRGLDDTYATLAVIGDELYVSSRGIIEKWDGALWTPIGSGGEWNTMTVSDTDLYCYRADGLAKWTGDAWVTLGSGTVARPDFGAAVRALAVIGTDVYAAGWFTTAGGVPARNIAKWSGGAWSDVGGGVSSELFVQDTAINTLAQRGSELFLGGVFKSAGEVSVENIAKWDGTRMASLNPGLGGTIYALTTIGADVYVGGEFHEIGGIAAECIAKWDGSSWSALGSGMGGDFRAVHALTVSGTDLYAAGYFSSAGGVPANCIAKWDGNAWSALGTGIDTFGIVYALASVGTDLYAGGEFHTAGGVPVNRIAKWNGSAWSDLGSGANGVVTTLCAVGPDLYVGGLFSKAGADRAYQVAKWDGSSWHALAPWPIAGVSLGVYAMVAAGSDLYIGGQLTNAGVLPSKTVLKWDGTSWSDLGLGPQRLDHDPRVTALAVHGTDLYVGGRFSSADGMPASNIAKWDGATWSDLGSGVSDGMVRALAVDSEHHLFVGGDFVLAGGQVSPHFAQANLPGAVPTSLPAWRQAWFGTPENSGNAADLADPYQTGVPNLLVYALFGPATNPQLARPRQFPQPRLSRGNVVITVTQPIGVTGITYGAEYSPTLMGDSWLSVPDTGTSAIHTFSVPVDIADTIFLRLKVTAP